MCKQLAIEGWLEGKHLKIYDPYHKRLICYYYYDNCTLPFKRHGMNSCKMYFNCSTLAKWASKDTANSKMMECSMIRIPTTCH